MGTSIRLSSKIYFSEFTIFNIYTGYIFGQVGIKLNINICCDVRRILLKMD